MKKKKILAALIFAFVLLLCSSVSKNNVYAIESHNPSSWSIPEAYAFRPRFTSSTTATLYPVGKYKQISGFEAGQMYLSGGASSVSKGQAYAVYTNVGMYNGQQLDMKITYTDWNNPGRIAFNDRHIGGGYAKTTTDQNYSKWIDVKVQFLAHGTNTPVSVKGHEIIYDLDSSERWQAKSGVEKIIEDSTHSGYYINHSDTLIGSTTGSGESNDGAAFAILYSGSEYVFRWYGRYFELASAPLFQIEVPSPTKTVSTNLAHIGERVDYTINSHVPDESSQYYYNSWTLTDNIPSCLSWSTSDVSITNEYGNNVTGNFSISKSGTTLSVTANNVRNAAFYNHVYSIRVNTTVIKDGLSNYTSTSGTILNNSASLTTNRGVKNSNTVTTEVQYQIDTDIDHGTITPDIFGVKGGSSQTVTWQPQRGYYVKSVKVDGVDQGTPNTTGGSYTFSDVTDNHSVEVTTEPMKVRISISKLDADNRNKTKRGDAQFVGAQYTIYHDAACQEAVDTVTLDADGNGTSRELDIVEYVGGSYNYYETFYIKETIAPEGYNLDPEVYTVTQLAQNQTTRVTDHSVTSYDEVIKNDIEITKYIEQTDSTLKQNLAGAIFTATLDSDSSQSYTSTPTDENGHCVIKDIPYGTYTVRETKVPDTAYNGEFYINGNTNRETTFSQSITVDSDTSETYKYNDITDVAKKMQITVYKEDIETGTITQGDAHLEGAKYGLYRDKSCTDLVEEITIEKQADGKYKAVSGWYLVGTYYVKETKAPEGYLIDETVYTVSQVPAEQKDERKSFEVTSKDEVIRNDIEIIKNLEETDSTEKQSLKGAVFTASLNSDPEQTWTSTPTDSKGYCIIEDLPYGTYTIRETTVPDTAYNGEFYVNGADTRSTTFEQFVEVDDTQREAYKWADITDVAKKMQIVITKEDIETGSKTQGDAHLEGAKYGLYRDKACTDLVEEITIEKQADGTYSAKSGWYLVGTYYVKETKAPEGYLIDETVYTVEQVPAEQTAEHSTHPVLSKDQVMKGVVRVRKYNNLSDSTTNVPAEGAKLRLTLVSNPDVYYDAVVDETGFLEFVDKEDEGKYYPYTIPYGVYEISEIQASNSGKHIFIDKQLTEIRYNEHEQSYIMSDEYVRLRLTIKKKDIETEKQVPGSGKYKIWNVTKQEWYQERKNGVGDFTDVLTTNSEGQITLNGMLEAGTYVIYEVQAPEGYYLDDELREGQVGYEFAIGVGKDGSVIAVHEQQEEILEYKVEKYQNIPTKIYSYEASIKNTPQKAQIKVEKLAEQLTKTEKKNSEYGSVNTPKFEKVGLEGVTFRLVAAEDVVTPEGTVRYTKGQIVSTFTTGKDGIGISDKVYLGKYTLEEISTPNGYVNETEPQSVEITYTEDKEEVQIINKTIENRKQNVKLEFEKVFEELKVSKFKYDERKAVFGVYTQETLKNYKGESVLGEDELVDVLVTDENNMLRNTVELPEGKYYVKEIYVSNPYIKSQDKYEFTVEYTNSRDEKIELTVNEGKVNNINDVGELELHVYPDEVWEEKDIPNITDREKLTELSKEYGVAGKTYRIYQDEECKKPVMTTDDKYADFITDENGMINIPDIPTGVYYLKETVAPYGYELSEEVIKAEIVSGKVTVLKAQEPLKKIKLLEKVDAFTKGVIKGVEFEITDKEGNLIYKAESNEKGIVEVPLILFKDGETYYYQEKSAPSMYKMNEEKQEFTAHFDENRNWDVETIKVENERNKSEVTFEKRDFADSTPVPNCKFELRSLETDFVVEGVTDEEGKYVFKDIPYGKYTYKELEAPEEYLIDTQEYEIEIDTEKITIKITNRKAPELPDTSDIAVYALSTILVVSVLGIVYVAKRNKKINN